MNQPIDDHVPAFPDPAREREWQLQEEALRRERLGLDPAADDARLRPYRQLARALREPLDAALPVDFAQQVIARVALAPAPALDIRFERALTLALGIVMAVAAAVVATLYGRAWLSPLTELLPALHPLAGRWLLAFATCLVATWLLGSWQRHVGFPKPG